jgi:hypothetical protein
MAYLCNAEWILVRTDQQYLTLRGNFSTRPRLNSRAAIIIGAWELEPKCLRAFKQMLQRLNANESVRTW